MGLFFYARFVKFEFVGWNGWRGVGEIGLCWRICSDSGFIRFRRSDGWLGCVTLISLDAQTRFSLLLNIVLLSMSVW